MRTPLDVHAHVLPDIPPGELTALAAHVVAVTRTPDEYETVRHRDDPTTVWALGCHPGLAGPQKKFDPDRFRQLAATAAVVGEVGLDGSSRVPLELQTANLTTILAILADTPLVTSLHSAGTTTELVDVIERHPTRGLVLHWWRGSPDDTRRALDAGCYFSVNSRELRKPAVLGVAPKDRILVETDHPFGDRSEAQPRRPGHMHKTLTALAERWDVTYDEAVRRTWVNWRDLAVATATADRLPASFRTEMLAA